MEALSCDLCWLHDSLSYWLTLGEWYPAHLTARPTTVSILFYKKYLSIVVQRNVWLRLWGISHSLDVNTAAAKHAQNCPFLCWCGWWFNSETVKHWRAGMTLGNNAGSCNKIRVLFSWEKIYILGFLSQGRKVNFLLLWLHILRFFNTETFKSIASTWYPACPVSIKHDTGFLSENGLAEVVSHHYSQVSFMINLINDSLIYRHL